MSESDVIERLDALIAIALRIEALKRKQLGLDVTTVDTRGYHGERYHSDCQECNGTWKVQVQNPWFPNTKIWTNCPKMGAQALSSTCDTPSNRLTCECRKLNFSGIWCGIATPSPAASSSSNDEPDKPYFCERCQIRTYKQHIHTEIP